MDVSSNAPLSKGAAFESARSTMAMAAVG